MWRSQKKLSLTSRSRLLTHHKTAGVWANSVCMLQTAESLRSWPKQDPVTEASVGKNKSSEGIDFVAQHLFELWNSLSHELVIMDPKTPCCERRARVQIRLFGELKETRSAASKLEKRKNLCATVYIRKSPLGSRCLAHFHSYFLVMRPTRAVFSAFWPYLMVFWFLQPNSHWSSTLAPWLIPSNHSTVTGSITPLKLSRNSDLVPKRQHKAAYGTCTVAPHVRCHLWNARDH